VFTRGAALIIMAVGSLVLLVVSAWLLYNKERAIGWTFFGLGTVGWLLYIGAVVLDVNNGRKAT
jgi:hypothetical protein